MKRKSVSGIEMQFTAHSDEARAKTRAHLRNAIQALKHGEDDNAMAHMLDAIVAYGRSEAFLDVAEDLTEFLGDDTK